MGQGLKVYDSTSVTIVAMGLPIDSTGGYADDEFLTIDQDSNDFDDVVGTDGEVTRNKTNDGRATITIKLMQSSSSNALLSVLRNLDVAAPNGAGVGPLLVRDRQGTSLYTASKCWISKPPKVSFAKGAQSREWTLRCADLKRLDGGN